MVTLAEADMASRGADEPLLRSLDRDEATPFQVESVKGFKSKPGEKGAKKIKPDEPVR